MKRRAALVVALTFGFWAVVRWVIYAYPQLGDTRVYQHAVRMIDAGFVPYRDFDIEYPPLATGSFWLIDRIPGPPTLVFSFAMCAALAGSAVAALVLADRVDLSRGRAVLAVAVTILLPVLLGTLLQTRYDLLLTVLLAWLTVAAVARRFGWMWTLLALATAIKLVPVLLVPVLAVWHLRHRGVRRTSWGIAGFSLGVAATFVPFFIMAPSGIWQLFAYHLERPLQMESLGSSVIHALGLDFEQVQSFGSDNIDGHSPQIAATLSTLALVVAIVVIAMLFLRVSGTTAQPEHLVTAVAATLLACVVFGKVVSPQYLAWLIPMVLVIPGASGAVTAISVTVSLPITQLVFPLMYRDLVERAAPLPVALLLIRNVLLVVALLATTAALVRAAGRRTARRTEDTPSVEVAASP